MVRGVQRSGRCALSADCGGCYQPLNVDSDNCDYVGSNRSLGGRVYSRCRCELSAICISRIAVLTRQYNGIRTHLALIIILSKNWPLGLISYRARAATLLLSPLSRVNMNVLRSSVGRSRRFEQTTFGIARGVRLQERSISSSISAQPVTCATTSRAFFWTWTGSRLWCGHSHGVAGGSTRRRWRGSEWRNPSDPLRG